MATFKKVIVRPGVYKVNTPNGREIRAVTKDFLKSVALTAKEMIKNGLKIPSPFSHKDESGIVPGPVFNKDGEELDASTGKKKKWSSDINAGFWSDFETNEAGELIGVVDVPGKASDLSSTAGKIRNTIKETSVFIEPDFTDGLGRHYKNALRHVALVTNAIEPNQDNFELLAEDQEFALAMSFSMADEVSQKPKDSSSDDNSDSMGSSKEDDATKTTAEETSSQEGNISELVTLVKDKLGFEMPSDTDEKNFLDRLRTILVSIESQENPDEEMDNLTKKPKDSETQSSTVIMANETNVTPNENKDNLVIMEKKLNKLLESHLATLREQFTSRIQALIAKGKIGRKYAEATLLPATASIAMSIEDMDDEGNFPKTPLEMALDMLDENTGLLEDTNETLNGTVEDRQDESEQIKMSQEEADAIYNELFN